jgi:hypothetical protein
MTLIGRSFRKQHWIQVKLIEGVIRNMTPAENEPTRTQITEAIKVYERDILKEATWHPLPP